MSDWTDDDLLDDDLEDDVEDELDDGDLIEDDGGEISDDTEALAEELSSDFAVADRGVQALTANRGAAHHQATMLGDILEKKLSGSGDITRITITFSNGRKLHITP